MDLNADLGELPGPEGEALDADLLAAVSSANVATGGHAGDDASMLRVARLAAGHGVRIGAHLSFEDRPGFGRRVPDRIDDHLVQVLRRQLDALVEAAGRAGTTVAYVKPHGALYHLADSRRDVAEALIEAVIDRGLGVLTLRDGELWQAATQAGLPAWAEFFADRGYLANGRLVPRGKAGDLVHQGLEDRVLQAVLTGSVLASTGEAIDLHFDSVCVHGDTPDAVRHARRIRDRLTGAGVEIRPFVGSKTADDAPTP